MSAGPHETPQAPASPAGRWQPPSASELAAMLPDYEITRLLGRGGMGAVYEGRQKNLDRAVALKILPPGLEEIDPDYQRRFRNEAMAMARLNHPGIVKVYDFGQTASGVPYIVMEYIEGTDVAHMIAKQGRLSTEHAMAVTAHVCDALAFAHEQGIIHRDIKPANIMVGYDGVVKVADFGLAKMSQAGDSALTRSGMTMGTLHYMAPEALVLGTSVDQRADIYAVGVMLYHMLVGKLPQGAFKLPSSLLPDLDPRYDDVLKHALREDREQRYQTILEMRHDLDGILTHPVPQVRAREGETPPAAFSPHSRPQRSVSSPPPPERLRMTTPQPSKKPSWLQGVVLVLGLITLMLIWQRITSGPASPGAEISLPESGQAVAVAPPSAEPSKEPEKDTKKPAIAADIETVTRPYLMARWKADGDARDAVGLNHGQLRGNVAFAKGIFGQAFELKGGHVEVPDAPVLRLGKGNAYTITVWTLRTDDKLPFHVFGKRLDDKLSKNLTSGYQLGIDATGPATPLNEWVFWTLVSDGKQTAAYVNGTLMKHWGNQPGPANNETFKIGGSANWATFRGLIDDLRIYTRALSHDEVSSFFAQQMAALPQSGRLADSPAVTTNEPQPPVANVWLNPFPAQLTHLNHRISKGRAYLNFHTLATLFSEDQLEVTHRAKTSGNYSYILSCLKIEGGFEANMQFLASPATTYFDLRVPVGKRHLPLRLDLKNQAITSSALASSLPCAMAPQVSHTLHLTAIPPADGKETSAAEVRLRLDAGPEMVWNGKEADLPNTGTSLNLMPFYIGFETSGAFTIESYRLRARGGKILLTPRDEQAPPAKKAPTVTLPPGELAAVRHYNGHSYLFRSGVLRWHEAASQAEKLGGHLATITSRAENDFIMDLCKSQFKKVNDMVWLGARRLEEGDHWGWITAEPWTFSHWVHPVTQKSNQSSRTIGDMLVMMNASEGQVWNDFEITSNPYKRYVVGYVVEWDSPSVEAAKQTGASSPKTSAASSATPDPVISKEKPFENSLGMKFVPVPITGGPTGGKRVLFSVWETRVQDYEVFASETKLPLRKAEFAQGPTHPAVFVSWEEARAFCAWLTERERKSGGIDATQVYRLPLDHEWSCAVGIGDREDPARTPMEKRVGLTDIFPWGKAWPPPPGSGNYSGEEAAGHEVNPTQPILTGYRDDFPFTAPAGSFAANPSGIFDLSGNVWEWCEDMSGSPAANRPLLMRGVAFNRSNQIDLASSFRLSAPSFHSPDLGFRIVLADERALSAENAPVSSSSKPVAPPPAGSVTATAATKDQPFVNSLGMKFVPVPITGGPSKGKLVLFSIWETRVQDYQDFAKETKREWPKVDFEQGPTHPAVNVSWQDAKAFCVWLSKKEGRIYRLPLDAEWSAAVGLVSESGDTPGDKSKNAAPVYPWGTQWPPPAGAGNYAGEEVTAPFPRPNWNIVSPGYNDGFPRTSPVGNFAPNRYGLYDMGGNIWELCEDHLDPSVKNSRYVLRGASWDFDGGESRSRSASRAGAGSAARFQHIGFRCVLELDDNE